MRKKISPTRIINDSVALLYKCQRYTKDPVRKAAIDVNIKELLELSSVLPPSMFVKG